MGRHRGIGEVVRITLALVVAILLASIANGTELPPEIQVDRLLIQAERQSQEGNHWSAVFTLERVVAVAEEHGLEIPTAFWFRQARAFQDAGLHERAIEASTRYLQEAGREGQHHRAALELLDAAEVALAEARREEARAKAAAERAAIEAEARRAAIALASPEMVSIPRSYDVPAFEISKYEVTFAQWDACVEYGTCNWVGDEGWGRGSRPVINVSWNNARTFVFWLSAATGRQYRLPSTKEWTLAALGGSKTRYSWGRKVGHNRANCRGCGRRMGQ